MPTLAAPKSTIGSFTAEAFAQHLAAAGAAPAWWLERKRAAYEKFASLPMPKRTDESWRFSNISTLTLDGFEVGRVIPNAPTSTSPFGPAHLAFANNVLSSRTALPADLSARGVIVTTLAEAATKHAD